MYRLSKPPAPQQGMLHKLSPSSGLVGGASPLPGSTRSLHSRFFVYPTWHLAHGQPVPYRRLPFVNDYRPDRTLNYGMFSADRDSRTHSLAPIKAADHLSQGRVVPKKSRE